MERIAALLIAAFASTLAWTGPVDVAGIVTFARRPDPYFFMQTDAGEVWRIQGPREIIHVAAGDRVSVRGDVIEATFKIRGYTDTREGHNKEQFYLTEHRYYETAKQGKVYYDKETGKLLEDKNGVRLYQVEHFRFFFEEKNFIVIINQKIIESETCRRCRHINCCHLSISQIDNITIKLSMRKRSRYINRINFIIWYVVFWNFL